MPAFIALLPQILQGIEVAIGIAPQVAGIVSSAKDLFNAMFKAGLITVEQQDAAHAYVDAIYGMRQAGIIPPAWQVEPDPGTNPANVITLAANTPAPAGPPKT